MPPRKRTRAAAAGEAADGTDPAAPPAPSAPLRRSRRQPPPMREPPVAAGAPVAAAPSPRRPPPRGKPAAASSRPSRHVAAPIASPAAAPSPSPSPLPLPLPSPSPSRSRSRSPSPRARQVLQSVPGTVQPPPRSAGAADETPPAPVPAFQGPVLSRFMAQQLNRSSSPSHPRPSDVLVSESDEEMDGMADSPALGATAATYCGTQLPSFSPGDGNDDDDDDDGFEDVELEAYAEPVSSTASSIGDADATAATTPPAAAAASKDAKNAFDEMHGFQIVVDKAPFAAAAAAAAPKKKPGRGIRKEDRVRRYIIHQTHLLCLLVSVLTRHAVCDDPQLQTTVAALLPSRLAEVFQRLVDEAASMPPPPPRPRAEAISHDASERPKIAQPFLSHMNLVARWWSRSLCAKAHAGPPPNRAKPSKPKRPRIRRAADVRTAFAGVGAAIAEHGLRWDPVIHGSIGDPETAALGFVALCRRMGVRARLVASLHPVSLQIKRHEVAQAASPVVDLTGSSGAAVGSRGVSRAALVAQQAATPPFVLWAEVCDPFSHTWMPVHVTQGVVNNPLVFDSGAASDPQSQLSYIVACEPGRGVKDVTRRYCLLWGQKTAKLRLPPVAAGISWWLRTLRLLSHDRQDHADDREQEQFETLSKNEAMPTTLAGFRDHPLYAIERDLRRHEVMHPAGERYGIGRFREWVVYPRYHVHETFSREQWARRGMRVRDGEAPAKRVPARAATVRRQREIVAAQVENARTGMDDPEADPSMTALFGSWQTEKLAPPPLLSGDPLPRNAFGNFEAFHPNAIPIGAVHIRNPGAAKVAKRLGIEHVPVVVDFSFRSGHSHPVIDGILVRDAMVEVLESAADTFTEHTEAEAAKKRRLQLHQRWRYMYKAVLTRARVMHQYADRH